MRIGSGARTHAHPDQGLRGAVADYYGYRRLSADAVAPGERPESVISLFLCFRELSAPGSSPQQPGNHLATGDSGAALDEVDTIYCGLQIDMTPLGAGRIVGLPPVALQAGHHDAAAVLGEDATTLLRQLASTSSWHVRFGAVDKFLLAKLRTARPRSLSVAATWRQFAQEVGTIVAGDLAWAASSEHHDPASGGSASPAPSNSATVATPRMRH